MSRPELPPILNFVRNPTKRESALVVLENDTPDLMAVLAECCDYTLVERARPDPSLPIMHFIRCPSRVAAKRLERAWAYHRLMKAVHGRM